MVASCIILTVCNFVISVLAVDHVSVSTYADSFYCLQFDLLLILESDGFNLADILFFHVNQNRNEQQHAITFGHIAI